MLNIRRTRGCIVANCVACLAIAVASAALANEAQNSSKPQKQDQQQATASQQQVSQSNNQAAAQSQANQKNQQSPRTYQRENKPDQAQQTAQHNQSSGKRGASLGVSITSDEDQNGVLVVRILPNTAAQRMGLQRRDRIMTLNGDKVRSADDFVSAISNMNPGDRVELKVVRNGNERTIRGELAGYSESVVETQGPSGNHAYRRFQSYIEPNQRNSEQAARNENRSYHEGTQANYENRGDSNQSRYGDIDARVTRLERQIERITQQIEDLVSNNNHGQPASAQKTAPPNTKTK